MADGGAGRELRARASLVTVAFTRHILTTLPSEGVMSWGVVSWTGKSDVYQQPLADLHGHCNNHIVTSCVFCASRPNLYHKTTPCWTLAEDLFSEWEERKKSRAGGGAPCESRETYVTLGYM